MQKDIALKQLAEHNEVFAEIFNQLAFGGSQIVMVDDLISIPTEAIVTDVEGMLREKRRDIVKADCRGNCYHLIFDLENQDKIDRTMPVRIMGYDFAAYEKQIRERAAENEKNGNKTVMERLREGQKLAPVISLILYWGTDSWDSPRCLYDILRFPEDTADAIKPLIPDYPINLVCMANLTEKQRSQLTTDIRILAEYVAYRKDPKRRKNALHEMFRKIRYGKETLTALEAIAGDRRYRQMVNVWEEKTQEGKKREEEVNVCEFLDEIYNDGKEEGLKVGLKEGICALIEVCRELGASQQSTLERIMRKFTLSQQEGEAYLVQYW